MTEPIWENGEPANDVAALADALAWLVYFEQNRMMTKEMGARLARCIADIRKRLPVPRRVSPKGSGVSRTAETTANTRANS